MMNNNRAFYSMNAFAKIVIRPIILLCFMTFSIELAYCQIEESFYGDFIQKAEQEMELARKNKTFDPENYLLNILRLANAYYQYQDYALARMYYWEFILQASSKNLYDWNDIDDLEILKRYSISSFYLGDYDESIKQFRGYLGQVQQLGDFNQEIIAYCWMTENYIKKKEYDFAWLGVNKIKELIVLYGVSDPYTLLLSKYVEANLICQTHPSKAVELIIDLPLVTPENDNDVEGHELLSSLFNLWGTCAMQLAQFDLASDVFQEGIEYMEQVHLIKGIVYYDMHFNLMLTLFCQGKNLSSVVSRLNSITIERIHDNFPKMTEKQRSAYWERFNEWLTFYLPRIASNTGNPDIVREAYTGLLIAKGLLLQSSISLQDYINHSGNEELMEIQDQIQYLNRKMQYWQNSDDENASQEIFSIATNSNRLQQRLLKETKKTDFMSDMFITVDSVKKNLLDGDVAIEIVDLNCNLKRQDSTIIRAKEYIAFVLKSNYKSPHVIKLCNSLSLPQNNQNISLLYDCIWKPLVDELSSVKRIFFSLDGELHKFPLEYVPTPTGQLMSELYQIYRLSSTRQLVMHNEHNELRQDICLFGNVDYNNSRGSTAVPTKNDILEKHKRQTIVPCDEEKRGVSEAESQTFSHLKYSKQETYSIALLCKAQNIKTQVFESNNATEEAFKALSHNSPKMIFLSTHGYNINESDDKLQMNIPIDKVDAKELSLEDESLSRSGLVLAGANLHLENEALPIDQEDGFVTARELTRMNLDNTDLVVLSACETGLGEVSSEGVIGLQHGFKRAGVNSIVMSLWKVNDYTTSVFMEHFYSCYFETNSKREAIKDAILHIRSVDNGMWDDPKYWAAFILLDGLD